MTEQANLDVNNEVLARNEDQQNLEYFLSEVGAQPAMNQLRPDQMRSIVETIIYLRMEPEGANGSTNVEDELQKALKKGGNKSFVPQSKSEAQTIIATPERRLAWAARQNRTEPLATAKTTYMEMVNRHKNALTEMDIINGVMHTPEDGDYQPDVSLLRNDRDALNLLGDHLMQKTFLANGRWPARNTHEYRDSQKYCRGAMLAAAKWAGDGVLEELIIAERLNIKSRAAYWGEKLQSIARTTAGVAVKSLIDKDENPHRPQVEERHSVTSEPEEPVEKEKLEVESYDEFIPTEVVATLAELAKKFEHRSHKIETLVRQGWSHRMAEISVLGAPGTYYEGQLVGVEPKDDKPSAEALVRSSTRSKPNPALSAGIRRLPGYDKRPDK
ncbi:MAG TPA: hypothetical protein VHD84_01605 [Candidatus Saccharimonadales bacterium]|nr:hypothetical protein [Candidatus Saccharimonadales bacterium]